ncbi:MAG: hypothetical protein HY941_06395 [Gammaproteobacteria bacterium]|nr:hypothetical protein [Gammaproteobacteria bacterium]
MPTRILIGLSLAVAIVVGVSIRELDHERLSALGSILSGAGSLLAVLWFSAGLRYQSKQLEEQRKQFAAQFQHLQETSRRDALMLAKGILDRAEEKTIAHHGSISSTNELLAEYTHFEELKPILESTNPHEVIRAYQSWMKKEGAALILFNGIKAAAEVYLHSIGTRDVDYSKSPEDFYFIYSPHFATLPFFNTFTGIATVLSEFMVRLAPGRNAALIAFFAANAKGISPEIIKMDKLRSDIEKHTKDGYPLPAIAHDL